jgi:flagellar motor component MotA
MLEIGEIDLGHRDDPPQAAEPVAAIVRGPGQGSRDAWLRQVLHELSVKARKYGLFSLEHDAQLCTDGLLRQGLEAVVDGVPPEDIQRRHVP